MGRKETKYYPVMLDVAGKTCLVVGGGPVAERKTLGLLEADASVKLVSPGLTARLAQLAADGVVQARQGEYRIEDLNGAWLVFAASSNQETNEQVARDAAERGIPANVADRSDGGDFITPAVVRRGDLVLAVSLSGASPSLASTIAAELSGRYGDWYIDYAAWLRRLRELALQDIADNAVRRRVLQSALDVDEAEWRGDTNEDRLRARLRLLAASDGGEAGISGDNGG
jgi:precorrin-2 dehydrogenase / sirohydrochlorin ferrochelatase